MKTNGCERDPIAVADSRQRKVQEHIGKRRPKAANEGQQRQAVETARSEQRQAASK
jgi:hypothetical protein